MSMTREEAIKVLNNFPIDFRRSGCFEAMGALKIAILALRPVSREQVEKVWRGEWEWFDEEVGSPLEGVERDWGWRCSKCKTVLPDDFDDPDNPPGM